MASRTSFLRPTPTRKRDWVRGTLPAVRGVCTGFVPSSNTATLLVGYSVRALISVLRRLRQEDASWGQPGVHSRTLSQNRTDCGIRKAEPEACNKNGY